MPVMGGDRADVGMVVALLGPVEIGLAGGAMTPVAQPRLRVLLGLLGVAGGRVVTAEALVDGVWGEEWSPGREKNLHALVYQLRRRLAVLGAGEGAGGGWCGPGPGTGWSLGPGELDVAVFAGPGRAGAGGGSGRGSRRRRGSCSGRRWGCGGGRRWPMRRRCAARLAGEAARLEELRLAVIEERIGCDLALGRHGEEAGELAGMVAENPLRERLAALLMTAFTGAGARGGLAVYDADALVLAGELGLDRGRSWPGCGPGARPMTRRWPPRPRRRCPAAGAGRASGSGDGAATGRR